MPALKSILSGMEEKKRNALAVYLSTKGDFAHLPRLIFKLFLLGEYEGENETLKKYIPHQRRKKIVHRVPNAHRASQYADICLFFMEIAKSTRPKLSK